MGENLNAAGLALNSALGIRKELLDLEAEALQAAFDLQLAAQTAEMDTRISLLGVSAAAKEAAQSPDDARKAVVERDALMSSAHTAKLAFYNTFGTAVNYRERSRFLRFVYQDSIRVLHQRLFAIRLGLNVHFGVDRPTLPVWDG